LTGLGSQRSVSRPSPQPSHLPPRHAPRMLLRRSTAGYSIMSVPLVGSVSLVVCVLHWEAAHIHRHRAIMINLVRRLATGECAAATTAESPPRIAIAMPGELHETGSSSCRVIAGAQWDIPELEVKWFGADADVDVEVHRAVEYWLEADMEFVYVSRLVLYLASGIVAMAIGTCTHKRNENQARQMALEKHILAAPRGYVSDKGDDEV